MRMKTKFMTAQLELFRLQITNLQLSFLRLLLLSFPPLARPHSRKLQNSCLLCSLRLLLLKNPCLSVSIRGLRSGDVECGLYDCTGAHLERIVNAA